MNLKKLITITLLFTLGYGLTLLTAATPPVLVEKIKFDKVFSQADTEWLQMGVTLKSNGASIKKYFKGSKFVKNVEVKATLGYPKKGDPKGFVFFDAKLKIAVMEGDKKRMAYFYMPGDVVEMYELDKNPEYAFVELTVDGKKLAINTSDKSIFGSLKKKQISKFLSTASAESQSTKGSFLPITDAPWYVQKKINFELMPSYIVDKY